MRGLKTLLLVSGAAAAALGIAIATAQPQPAATVSLPPTSRNRTGVSRRPVRSYQPI